MKPFIISVSCMAGVIIACLTLNITLNNLTKAPSDIADISQPDNNIVIDDQMSNTTPNGSDTTDVSAVNSNRTNKSNSNSSNSNTQKQNNSNSNASNGANPLTYSKEQIVSYYNNALKLTYSQPKFTVQKKEVVDVQLGQMLLNGKPAEGVQSLANKVIESNKKNAGTKTESFTKNNVRVDAQARFILPANLYSGAVKSYNVAKSGSGYVVKFTLNSENCDYTQKPPYNSSCTFPLDFNEVDLGGIGKITSATFNYPGTTLEATIDGSGRVVKTYVVMPLTVKGAQGEGMGQKLTVDISGQWLCTNNFSF